MFTCTSPVCNAWTVSRVEYPRRGQALCQGLAPPLRSSSLLGPDLRWSGGWAQAVFQRPQYPVKGPCAYCPGLGSKSSQPLPTLWFQCKHSPWAKDLERISMWPMVKRCLFPRWRLCALNSRPLWPPPRMPRRTRPSRAWLRTVPSWASQMKWQKASLCMWQEGGWPTAIGRKMSLMTMAQGRIVWPFKPMDCGMMSPALPPTWLSVNSQPEEAFLNPSLALCRALCCSTREFSDGFLMPSVYSFLCGDGRKRKQCIWLWDEEVKSGWKWGMRVSGPVRGKGQSLSCLGAQLWATVNHGRGPD